MCTILRTSGITDDRDHCESYFSTSFDRISEVKSFLSFVYVRHVVTMRALRHSINSDTRITWNDHPIFRDISFISSRRE